MLRLFILAALVTEVYCTCAILNCPPVRQTSNAVCTNCTDCLSKTKFCVTGTNNSCGCASSIPATCSRTVLSNFTQATYCYLPEAIPLPLPTIRPEGTAALSVIVDRFFIQPRLASRVPSNLHLLAHFITPKNASCHDIHSIQAQRRSEHECFLRIRLTMPGIDHRTQDHYYYDDGTDLETNFATDMFEGAQEVSFWIEVTLQQVEQISSGNITFSTIARSQPVRHLFPGQPLSTKQPTTKNLP